MTFERLTPGDWVAFVAALALLLFLAMDWYSTVQGDEARRIQDLTEPSGALAGEFEREADEDARQAAERAERNAFQEDGAIDRLLLVVLLAAIVCAVVAAYARAAGKRFEPPRTPSAAAALLGVAGALLVAYRIVQEPGLDAGTTVKTGALLGLIAAGLISLGARAAYRRERDGTTEMKPEPQEATPT